MPIPNWLSFSLPYTLLSMFGASLIMLLAFRTWTPGFSPHYNYWDQQWLRYLPRPTILTMPSTCRKSLTPVSLRCSLNNFQTEEGLTMILQGASRQRSMNGQQYGRSKTANQKLWMKLERKSDCESGESRTVSVKSEMVPSLQFEDVLAKIFHDLCNMVPRDVYICVIPDRWLIWEV